MTKLRSYDDLTNDMEFMGRFKRIQERAVQVESKGMDPDMAYFTIYLTLKLAGVPISTEAFAAMKSIMATGVATAELAAEEHATPISKFEGLLGDLKIDWDKPIDLEEGVNAPDPEDV